MDEYSVALLTELHLLVVVVEPCRSGAKTTRHRHIFLRFLHLSFVYFVLFSLAAPTNTFSVIDVIEQNEIRKQRIA